VCWRILSCSNLPNECDFSALHETIRAELRDLVRPSLPAAGGDDADLLAAERAYAEWQADESIGDDDDVTWQVLSEKITVTPPTTLAGAAVKLRAILALEDIGNGLNDDEIASLRQVLALIEREAQP